MIETPSYNDHYQDHCHQNKMMNPGKSVKLLGQLASKYGEFLCRFSSSATASVQEERKTDKLYSEDHRQLQRTVRQVGECVL